MIVLAVLLAVRQGSGPFSTETATDEIPPSSVEAQASGSETRSGGSSGFGDLPPSAGGGDDRETTTTTEPSTTTTNRLIPDGGADGDDPTDRSDVEPLDCPAGVEQVICDAAEFVQLVRGRPFKEFPDVELLGDAAFDEALLGDFDEYRDDLEVSDTTLTALGLLDPQLSLADVFRESLEVGVVGFYDPEDGRLVVRGDDFGLYFQLVLVHELVHAFDDQWFDLDRSGFDDDEADYGFTAIIEGNATRIENLWRSQLSGADQAALSQEELTALSPDDIDRLLALPAIVRDLQASPYTDGDVYVRRLAAAGGEAAVDEALEAPPTSSEEILHPTVDRSTEPEVTVPVPPADGTVIDEGRLGELLIRSWIGRLAAAGWGGDRYVTWSAGGQDCIRADLIGDDVDQTEELDAAADAWAALRPDNRTVESTTIAGRAGVRVTACH